MICTCESCGVCLANDDWSHVTDDDMHARIVTNVALLGFVSLVGTTSIFDAECAVCKVRQHLVLRFESVTTVPRLLVASEQQVRDWGAPRKAREVLDSPGKALRYLLPHMMDGDKMAEREHMVLLALNPLSEVVGSTVISIGSAMNVLICPNAVLRWALRLDYPVRALVIAHNHPSGDPNPSREDIQVTYMMHEALKQVNIQLHDHIVVGDAGKWRSLAELGLMPRK